MRENEREKTNRNEETNLYAHKEMTEYYAFSQIYYYLWSDSFSISRTENRQPHLAIAKQ